MYLSDKNRYNKTYPLIKKKPKYVDFNDLTNNIFDEIAGEVLSLWEHSSSILNDQTYDIYPINFEIKPGNKFYLFQIDPFELDIIQGDIVLNDITTFALNHEETRINNQFEYDAGNDEMIFDGNFNKTLTSIVDDNNAVHIDLKNPYFTLERVALEIDVNRPIDLIFEGYVAENMRKVGNSADLDFWL